MKKWKDQCKSCFNMRGDMCGVCKEHPGGDCAGFIHKDDKQKAYELAAAMREYAKRKGGR